MSKELLHRCQNHRGAARSPLSGSDRSGRLGFHLPLAAPRHPSGGASRNADSRAKDASPAEDQLGGWSRVIVLAPSGEHADSPVIPLRSYACSRSTLVRGIR